MAWCLANPKIGEREVAQELLAHARDRAALRDGMIVRTGKGLAGEEMEHFAAEQVGVLLVRPDRKDENAASVTWPGCGNGSSQSTTPSRANSTWNSTAGVPAPASTLASPNAYSPWPPRSGTTGPPTRPSNAR
jgi:hypothetical protein